MFRLTMNPASDGDALILSWGREGDVRHALVDLGRQGDYRRLVTRLAEIGTFELFVITHVDADHIAGTMPLVAGAQAPFQPKEVWFNGRDQLEAATLRGGRESLGALQGEKLQDGIEAFSWPWNGRFESRIVSVNSSEAKAPLLFPGGLAITLLSPTDAKLTALAPDWDAELAEARLRRGDDDEEVLPPSRRRETFSSKPDVADLAATRFVRDATSANGSSIAFLAEFGCKRVLLAADAHPEVLAAAIRPLAEREGGRLRLDCLKVSHHGSQRNTSPELLALLDCGRFAFSTDGSRHGHPDAELIARILAGGKDREKTLYFNSRHDETTIWADPALAAKWKYDCVFPPGENSALEIDL